MKLTLKEPGNGVSLGSPKEQLTRPKELSKNYFLLQSDSLVEPKMSAPNAGEPEIYMELEVDFFGGNILGGKGGESSEVGGKHVALLTQMQGLVPTQR